jgi:hypothetical protein
MGHDQAAEIRGRTRTGPVGVLGSSRPAPAPTLMVSSATRRRQEDGIPQSISDYSPYRDEHDTVAPCPTAALLIGHHDKHRPPCRRCPASAKPTRRRCAPSTAPGGSRSPFAFGHDQPWARAARSSAVSGHQRRCSGRGRAGSRAGRAGGRRATMPPAPRHDSGGGRDEERMRCHDRTDTG